MTSSLWVRWTSLAEKRRDPKFKARVRKVIDEDRELLERLAR